MTDSSESSRQKGARHRSPSPVRAQNSKLFITNIDGKADIKEIQDNLRQLFEKCGVVETIVAKRNRNSEYCFAFAEMKDYQQAVECVKKYDQSTLNGKQIKIEFQDDNKRRKDSGKGCYNCGKMGHFARECNSARNDVSRGGYRKNSRSRSRSEDSERRKKRRRRNRSGSSDRRRSPSQKSKKQRRNRSKDREEKRKKKHRRSNSSS